MELKFKIDQKKVFKVFSGNSGLSPFHSFYCNKKTILRNCGGRLYAHYNGEDINQIAEYLLDLLTDEKKCNDFGKNGRQKMLDEFTEEGMIDGYLQIINAQD